MLQMDGRNIYDFIEKINFLLFSFVVIFPFSCQHFHSVSHRKKKLIFVEHC